MTENTYDKRDMVVRKSVLAAGGFKLASYQVRDPQTSELSPLQFHATFDNIVLAVMGEQCARLFVNFVSMNLPDVAIKTAPTSEDMPLSEQATELVNRVERALKVLNDFQIGYYNPQKIIRDLRTILEVKETETTNDPQESEHPDFTHKFPKTPVKGS